MKKKLRYLALTLALALGLSGCGEKVYVPVERVDRLVAATVAADQYAGVVVSENAVTVPRDTNKELKELHVKEGDQVYAGTRLFTYDTEALQLQVDKQNLDLERLKEEIKNVKADITQIKKDITAAEKKKDKNLVASLNTDLRERELTQTQKEYEKKSLEKEISYNKELLKIVHVTSPIDGTVRTINSDNLEQYIIIQESGAYRVKGQLNELNIGSGIMEGVAVEVVSRLNPQRIWTGTVSVIDYENTEQNSYDVMYNSVGSEMTGTSSYPFYVALDSTEGLLLGQHVYVRMAMPEIDETVVWIPESYLMDLTYDPETDATVAYVWAVGEDGRLEKRLVTVGDYDSMTGSYTVLEGLTFTDYVADPAHPDCKEGAHISIYGQTGYVDNSGLTPEEKAAIEASIAAGIEYGE